MNKILITGGAGFIGSHIVDKLIENGEKVIVVDNLSTGKIENINDKAIFYKVDITDEKINMIFEKEKPDYVIHQAAQINVNNSIKDPLNDAKINVLGTINLLENCRKFKVKKIIYASSAAVYGHPKYLGIDEKHKINPISFYGISKYTPEEYIQTYNELYGLDYTILRYANVYGPRQSYIGEGGIIPIFINKIISKEQLVIFGDGKQTRDFIFVKDVVDANILSVKKGFNRVLNIGTGNSTSINELYFIMNEIMGSKIKPIYGEERIGDIKENYFNCVLAKSVLGWEAQYTLKDGLRETIVFYREKS